MVQSINTKVDICESGTSFHGLTTYGKIMIGDKGFEFFNDRNVSDYIQIPWEEVDIVTASVLFKGKAIPRFSIITRYDGDFSFAAKNPKAVLRAIGQYIPGDRMLRSLNAFEVVKKRLIGDKKKKK